MSGLPKPRRRSDGRWEVQVEAGYTDGKRRRKSIYGKTAKECTARMVEFVSARKQGVAVMDERTTLAQYLPRWLDNIAPSLRPHTRRFYGDQVRLHLVPAFGHIPLAKITPEQVQRFVNAKSAEGLAPRMVRHLRSTLRAALNQAVEWELIARNPAARAIRLPALGDREVNALTPEQARQVLVAAGMGQDEKHRLYALWVTTMFLGLRQGEVLALRWQSVDWDAGTLRVDRSLQRIDGHLQLVPTKTAYSVRTLTMPPTVAAALRVHRAAQDAERRGNHWIEHGLIFATQIGTPIDPRNLIREWHALTRRAGIPRVRFHDLRHTAATLMLAGGVDVKLVAETLGHRDATMVLKVYSHVLPSARTDAAERMERMLAQ